METNRIIRITSKSMKSTGREKFLENIFTNCGIKLQSQGRCKGGSNSGWKAKTKPTYARRVSTKLSVSLHFRTLAVYFVMVSSWSVVESV